MCASVSSSLVKIPEKEDLSPCNQMVSHSVCCRKYRLFLPD
jgi:hypothetical protein